MSTYYIPINSESLPHYYGKALILPAANYSNRKEDIQNRLTDSILLSNKKWVKNCDCSIEIILTESDKQFVNVIDEVFSETTLPLPITRVKSVFFLSEAQKETTLWNINNTTAYIPESLVHVEESKDINFVLDQFSPAKQPAEKSDFKEKINRYDILLGGFAFMRLGGKSYMNFSDNYFSTLSFFNKRIEEETKLAEKEGKLIFSDKYYGLFTTKNESSWSNWLNYIYTHVTQSDVEELAQMENIKLQKNLNFINLNSIGTHTHLYELAVLSIYGDRKSKSLDNLVTDLNNGLIDEKKKEDISLVVGLHHGYSKLRNKYRIGNKDRAVKFTLESKLDYYTIESLYQFAFFGIKGIHTFAYLDSWCPTNKKHQTKISGFDTYKILDTDVIVRPRPSIVELHFNRLSKEIYSVVNENIKKWAAPYTKHNDVEAMAYFEKILSPKLISSFQSLENELKAEQDGIISNLEEKYLNDIQMLEQRLIKLEEGLANKNTKPDENSVLQSTLTSPIKQTNSSNINIEISDEKIDIVQSIAEPTIYHEDDLKSAAPEQTNFGEEEMKPDVKKIKENLKIVLDQKKKAKKKETKDSAKKGKDELF